MDFKKDVNKVDSKSVVEYVSSSISMFKAYSSPTVQSKGRMFVDL